MDIGIIGAGAIGGWIAARLALAGEHVSVLARGRTLEALRDGLTILENGAKQRAEVKRSGDPNEIGPQDVLVIAVKGPALAKAAGAAAAMIGPETLVVPMMNGVPWWFLGNEPIKAVDPDGTIAASLPFSQLVGSVVHAACRRTAPGEIEVVHADRLIIGEPMGGPSERVERLAGMFRAAGIHAEPSDDIRRSTWYKLWGNMTINPISALTLAPSDKILAEAGIRQFILACMAEAAAIGEAIGCPVKESGEERMAVTARLGSFRTSMLQDVEAGRAIELEALVGAPLEIARKLGVSAPNIETLYGLARLMGESRSLL